MIIDALQHPSHDCHMGHDDKHKSIDWQTILGTNLQQARKSRGMTQEQLAEHLSVEPATVSRYETGQRTISLELIFKVANILDISVEQLIPLELQQRSNPQQHQFTELLKRWELLDEEGRALVVALLRRLTTRV